MFTDTTVNLSTLYMLKGDYVITSYTKDFILSVALTTVPVATKEAVECIQMDDTSVRSSSTC